MPRAAEQQSPAARQVTRGISPASVTARTALAAAASSGVRKAGRTWPRCGQADWAVCGDGAAAAVATPADPKAATSVQGAEVDEQAERAQRISNAGAAVCPLCLGIMQSLDAGSGGLSETQRRGGAAVALPDRDAGGGSWLLATDSSPAGLAASIRWVPSRVVYHARGVPQLEQAGFDLQWRCPGVCRWNMKQWMPLDLGRLSKADRRCTL